MDLSRLLKLETQSELVIIPNQISERWHTQPATTLVVPLSV